MLLGFGFSGINPWSLLIILVIVLVIFGTKRLRNAGGDLGGAVKNFKKAVKDEKESLTQKKDDAIDVESNVKDKVDRS